MALDKILYTGRVKTTGGRDGRSVSTDGVLDVKLASPKEMGGGTEKGTNPEQLFAAGYSACFLGAIKFAARNDKITVPPDASIEAAIDIGPLPTGFGLRAELRVSLPGMERAQAEALVQKAHTICPYSNATRGNIDVKLVVV